MAASVVLIVDDEDPQRAWVREVVETYFPAWTVEEADSLNEATTFLRRTDTHPCDLGIAIIDLNLSKPENRAEGLQLAQTIRKSRPGCFIILTSNKKNLRESLLVDDPRIHAVVPLGLLNPDPTQELLGAVAKATQHLAGELQFETGAPTSGNR